ncbi:MBL fold metallo-hydrolase [Streptomyces sp. 110]|uniref:MBL fold metallo-hydrolase n=2 Tax=Streptomyces endocoffeicus TaxID=2898945 RepID=A0ABS1Q7K1_9ACTN|nr:MBL fold metallo-hydrolase [Streptomyces endocoffeicus]
MHSDQPLRPMNRRGFIGAAAGISAGFGAAALLDGGRALTSGTHGTPAATSEQAMQASTITLGNVTISRVAEYTGPVGMTSREFFPDSPEKLWRQNRSWLSPDFWNPDTDAVRIALQTWVLRSEGRAILIDTGAGNDKFRPYAKTWQYRDTGFLRRLSRAGVRPQDVDIVVNTHLHNDHVGWNTRSHTIDGNLTLDLAPGHPPGSSVVRLQSGGDRAVFAGDLLHTPLQLEHPEFDSCFEEDEKQARTTRRRRLEWAANHEYLTPRQRRPCARPGFRMSPGER